MTRVLEKCVCEFDIYFESILFISCVFSLSLTHPSYSVSYSVHSWCYGSILHGGLIAIFLARSTQFSSTGITEATVRAILSIKSFAANRRE